LVKIGLPCFSLIIIMPEKPAHRAHSKAQTMMTGIAQPGILSLELPGVVRTVSEKTAITGSAVTVRPRTVEATLALDSAVFAEPSIEAAFSWSVAAMVKRMREPERRRRRAWDATVMVIADSATPESELARFVLMVASFADTEAGVSETKTSMVTEYSYVVATPGGEGDVMRGGGAGGGDVLHGPASK